MTILRGAKRGAKRKTLFRKHGISEQALCHWKRMHEALGVPEIKRIKQLEEENRKLKQIVRERAMVIQAQSALDKRTG